MYKKRVDTLECDHCQQPVSETVPGDDGAKVYCCYGCKLVDQLLENPGGTSLLSNLNLQPFRYLDETKVRASLLNFDHGGTARVQLHLPAIHCSSCIYLLENLPQVETSILGVQVHFARKQAIISFRSNELALSQLAALLDYLGYTPDFQTRAGGTSKSKNHLLIQMGVAGFFFGNTMLLALPEYFDESLAADPGLQNFFRYLMLLFSLPVVLYSARDYYRTAFKSLRAGSLSIDLPIALGVTVLFARSAYEVFSGMGPGYFDSLTGLVFFLLVGKWYQQKTYDNFSFDRDLRSFLPLAANRLHAGKENPVAIDDLAKGDEIIVRQGEILPADAELLSAHCQIDYSYLTGESLPVQKQRSEKVFAGARVVGGAVHFSLCSTVSHSYLSSLWSHEAFAEGKQKYSRNFTDRISQYFSPAVLFIALMAGAVWSFFDVSKAIFVSTAVLIVACPCALALAEPFAAGSLMRWYGRFGFFLKNSAVLRRLQEIDHLVFDKTGTLTLPQSVVVEWHGEHLALAQKRAIASLATQAQHPLAKALLQFLAVEETAPEQLLHFEETTGEGLSAQLKGKYYRMGKASFIGIGEQATTTAVYLQEEDKVLGYFSFFQETRTALPEVIAALQNHYGLSLLSGDNSAEEQRFRKILGEKVQLHFNCAPHQKLNQLAALQQKSHKVLMLGDGLNDAGALQQSEVGVSLCEEHLNFFPASDALLQAKAFSRLGQFLALARQNKKIVRQAFAISFAYNVVGVSVAVAGWLSPLFAAILMPVSSVTVVVFVTLRTAVQARRALAKSSA